MDSDEAVIRAATWNVWWRFGDAWEQRERGIVKTLRDLAPDIVGLQESWELDGTSQAGVLGEALGMHGAFVGPGLPPIPDPLEHEGQERVTMGLGLLSRWPISDLVAHAMPSSDRALVALVASIDHPLGPLYVIVAALSWEPEKLDETGEQILELARLAGNGSFDGPLPVLVLADCNYDFTFAPLAQLSETMTDAWGAVNDAELDDPRTLSETNRFAPPEAVAQYNHRIDHVLVRAGERGETVDVRDAWIVRDEFDGLPPSDHYLVVADIAV